MFSGCPMGCAANATCCCIEQDCCCTNGVAPLCCICCAIRCVAPTTCMKSEQQCCCCVTAEALPCDEEVPCMLACCFLDCYPKCGCCQSVSTLNGKGGS